MALRAESVPAGSSPTVGMLDAPGEGILPMHGVWGDSAFLHQQGIQIGRWERSKAYYPVVLLPWQHSRQCLISWLVTLEPVSMRTCPVPQGGSRSRAPGTLGAREGASTSVLGKHTTRKKGPGLHFQEEMKKPNTNNS